MGKLKSKSALVTYGFPLYPKLVGSFMRRWPWTGDLEKMDAANA